MVITMHMIHHSLTNRSASSVFHKGAKHAWTISPVLLVFIHKHRIFQIYASVKRVSIKLTQDMNAPFVIKIVLCATRLQLDV
jgi:hypothetical protein